MPDMTDNQFTTLLTLISDFKSDMNNRFEQVDKRFTQIDNRFEQVDNRFEQIDRQFEQVNQRFLHVDEQINGLKYEIRDIKHDIREMKVERHSDQEQLQDIYNSRNKVVAHFTQNWIIASFFISMLSSTVVLTISQVFL
jgi:type IV secretion system protein TrbJ